MNDHHRIKTAWALQLLDELAERAFATTVHSYSMANKEFQCELCGKANWRAVTDKDGQPLGRLVTCRDCNAVYERPALRPTMGRREVGEAPNWKTYGPTPKE